MQEVLVNRLGGLSLSRKSVVRLTDRPDMTLDVYRGHKTTIQQQQHEFLFASLENIALTSGLYSSRRDLLLEEIPLSPLRTDSL